MVTVQLRPGSCAAIVTVPLRVRALIVPPVVVITRVWSTLLSVKVLVTGATGLVGAALVRRMAADRGWLARAAVRRQTALPPGVECVQTGDLTGVTDWDPVLEGVQAIVHLAARAHVMRESVSDPLAEFRRAAENRFHRFAVALLFLLDIGEQGACQVRVTHQVFRAADEFGDEL